MSTHVRRISVGLFLLIVRPLTPLMPAWSHLFTRVDEALARGEAWRAREMLQGLLRSTDYDAALYEMYGRVLLRMGDLPEAGKYLFLSGARISEYEAAVALFLKRNSHHTWQQLFSTFPHGARRAATEDFPAVVRLELERLQMPPRRADKPKPVVVEHRQGCGEKLAIVGCALAGIFIIACFAIGFAMVLDSFGKMFR